MKGRRKEDGERAPCARDKGPLKVAQVAFCNGHTLGLVAHHYVHDPIWDLNGQRANVSGLVSAQPPALDHGGTPHSDVGAFCGNNDVTHTEHRSVAGEAVPGHESHQGDKAAETPECGERSHGQTRASKATVGVAGTPPATLGEPNDGEVCPLARFQNAIGLVVAVRPLGAESGGRRGERRLRSVVVRKGGGS
jgi:hypothetical protein